MIKALLSLNPKTIEKNSLTQIYQEHGKNGDVMTSMAIAIIENESKVRGTPKTAKSTIGVQQKRLALHINEDHKT